MTLRWFRYWFDDLRRVGYDFYLTTHKARHLFFFIIVVLDYICVAKFFTYF